MGKEQEKQNIELLIEHFEEGCKKNCVQKLGVEIEHFIVDKTTKRSITYYEENGVASILMELATYFPKKEIYANEHLIGMYNQDYSISLEPAGQIEISIAPRESIASIYQIYRNFLKIINPILIKYNYELVTLGYHPKSKIKDLPLIPKKRYQFMDEYFKKVDTCGANMMRGTAATQVSIDYCSEGDFVLKYRAAYILMPLLKLLTDNTPVFEGEIFDRYLARTHIWNHVDAARTGIIPGLFEEGFGFAAYANYLWNLPLIFVADGDVSTYVGEKNAKELWQGKTFSDEDIEHVLSMTFLDVRLKHYIEIRPADSMPIEYVLGYLALIKGIFFEPDALRSIMEQYKVNETQILQAQEAIVEEGYDAKVYGRLAYECLEEIIEISGRYLGHGERIYLLPLKKLVADRMTLARK